MSYAGPLTGPGTTRSTGSLAGPMAGSLAGSLEKQAGDPWDAGGVGIGAAGVVSREIALTTIATSWDVPGVRGALAQLVRGMFDAPSQLWDAIIGDDRVQATMGSRTGGLLGRPVKFERATADTDGECLDAWQAAWPSIAAEPIMSVMLRWAIGLGFGGERLANA